MTMKFNKDQIGWQSEQNNEDRHFISVGGFGSLQEVDQTAGSGFEVIGLSRQRSGKTAPRADLLSDRRCQQLYEGNPQACVPSVGHFSRQTSISR
jgi:hypothetical protein